MNAVEVLHRLQDLGVSVWADGNNVVVSPASKIPSEVRAAIKEHKSGILASLRPIGDGQPPPLHHPPENETELRRLIDWQANPTNFSMWLQSLMDREE